MDGMDDDDDMHTHTHSWVLWFFGPGIYEITWAHGM